MLVRINWRSVLLASGTGGRLPGSVSCGAVPQVVTQWPSAANNLCEAQQRLIITITAASFFHVKVEDGFLCFILFASLRIRIFF